MTIEFQEQFVDIEHSSYDDYALVKVTVDNNIEVIATTYDEIDTGMMIKGSVDVEKIEDNKLYGTLKHWEYAETFVAPQTVFEAKNAKVFITIDGQVLIEASGWDDTTCKEPVSIKPLQNYFGITLKNIYKVIR